MDGIIILNKPKGYTSMDCCAVLRKICGEKKAGHAGTLDPNAEGVLPVCIGKATRLIEYMETGAKSYRCGCRLGYFTDTQDIWGTAVSEKYSGKYPSEEEIRKQLFSFIGEISQIPPKYSAIKINGRKLYDYARAGQDIEIKPRKITVQNIDLLSYSQDEGTLLFDITCSKGTYVRTICHDLGIKLGTGACMESLLRTMACGFYLNEAVTLDEIREKGAEAFIRPSDLAVSSLPKVKISERQRFFFTNGVNTYGTCEESAENGPETVFSVYCGEEFVGTAKSLEKGVFKPVKVFK